jgi:hypothetical protein
VSLVGPGKASPRTRTVHVPHARAAPIRTPLPDVLTDLESGAEDIVDYALSGDRSSAISAAADVKASANGPAAKALTASGVSAPKVRALESRAKRLARVARNAPLVQIALTANAVSQLMPDLYAHFRNRVPPSILALDYFDREAQLRSLARQSANVTVAVEGLRATWPRVRPKVRAAGGREEAAAFDLHVRTMAGLRSGAAKKVQAEAIRGLELVDELERVFTG